MNHKDYIKKAIKLSQESFTSGGYPVGALVVMDDEIISFGFSKGNQKFDPTLHAETDALRKASKKLQKRDLHDAVLYSSMEPCLMCLAACTWAKIDKIYFAVSRKKLPQVCFEGNHDSEIIIKQFYRDISVVHMEEYENEAWKIYKEWEEKIV